jgi:hypothetical protein
VPCRRGRACATGAAQSTSQTFSGCLSHHPVGPHWLLSTVSRSFGTDTASTTEREVRAPHRAQILALHMPHCWARCVWRLPGFGPRGLPYACIAVDGCVITVNWPPVWFY